MQHQKLQMAQLIPLPGDDKAPASSGGEAFTVPFNPASLKVTYTNSLADASGGGATQKSGKGTEELAVDLLFDTTDLGAGPIEWGDSTAQGRVQAGKDVDVRIFTARIVQMMQAQGGKTPPPGGKDGAPPRVKFVWGSFLFVGVLKSLTESLEHFSAQGIPLRANLSLSLSRDLLEYPNDRDGAGDQSSLFTPLAGANAAGAMSTLGLDPQSGKAMASLNGLDDLRQLPSGVALSAPGASLGVGASLSAGITLGASGSASFVGSVSASASLSASVGLGVSAAESGGFGGGRGIDVTLGGGGNFGLDAGASFSAGFSASASLQIGGGIAGSLGMGGGLSIGASAGLNIGVSGGISGGVAGIGGASVALLGSGSVGGPRNGLAPGAQVLMDAGGRMALAPAAPPRAISPPSTSPAVATDRTRTAPPPSQMVGSSSSVSEGSGASVPSGGSTSRVIGAVGVAARQTYASPGWPAPLPPQSTGAARGAFEGIHGVPLKQPRFSVGVPPPRALAYRRLGDPAVDVDWMQGSATGAGASTSTSTSTSTSRGCGCSNCQRHSQNNKGVRCGCQH